MPVTDMSHWTSAPQKKVARKPRAQVDTVMLLLLLLLMTLTSALLFNRVVKVASSRDVILGSSSPRRREIMADLLGFGESGFRIMKPSFEEDLSKDGVTPSEYTMQTAMGKATSLLRELDEKTNDGKPVVIICADTTVDLDGAVLEKPRDAADAERMLMSMSGREHRVHTSVVICSASGPVSSFVETATVRFTPFSAEDVRGYIATGEPKDKAGAYGIQGMGAQLVESISGDYYAVMGLPVRRLGATLASLWDEGKI